jgi:hypothetical protein
MRSLIMKFKFINFFNLTIIVGLLSIILISCSKEENPLPPQEEHFEAEGMVFLQSGIMVASIFRGVTTDTLIAPEGGRSDHFDVKFYDENQNVIDPPSSSDQTLDWEIENENLLTVWQHPGEEGGYEFHLDGLAEGTTHIEFFIVHEGHNDYRSGLVPVRVEHDPTVHGEPTGIILKDEESGDTLVTVNNQASTITGSVELTSGDTTDHIEVVFVDDNGIEFQPGVPDHSITITSNDTNTAGITGLDPGEPFAFKVNGVNAGSTTLTIELLHEGNVEKTFDGIPVNVQ